MISASGEKLWLPHQSVGWTIGEYVEWFNCHTEVDRFKFLSSLTNSYRQSVVAKGDVEFVALYPTIQELIEHNLKE